MASEQEEFEFRARAEQEAQKPARSFFGINRQNLPSTVSSFARPALEMGGAVGGGAIGLASPIPGGAAIGGATGFAGGKSAADLLDRYLGLKKPLQNIQQAGTETLGNVRQGAENELINPIAGKVLSSLAKPAARFAGNAGRIISGVKPQMGERLFKDPGAFLSPSMASSGEALGNVRSKLGINTSRTPEEVLDPELTLARKTARDLIDKANKKIPVSLSELVKGSQSMDDIIEATPMNQRNKRRELFGLKDKITSLLGEVVPEERQAAKKFSQSALAGEFRKFFPVTKSGDVSVLRTLGLGSMNGGAKAAAVIPSLLQSPALSGTTIAGAGGAYQALQNPTVRRELSAALRALRNKNEDFNP